MSRRIVYVQKNRGGCLWALFALVFLSLVIAAAALAACVAAGVGLWFLIRYIWRSLVREKPDSNLVKWGLGLAPIARKALAAAPCAFVAVCLIGALGSASTSSKSTVDGDKAVSAQQTAFDDGNEDSDEGNGSSDKELTTVEKREAALESFIYSYNATAATPFVLDEYFDPQDEMSGYYRAEYRLLAWKDGKGANGKVGDIGVDFVSYRDGVRMYASIGNADLDQVASLLDGALKTYLAGTSAESIDTFVQEYREGGTKNLGSSKLMLFDNRLNGDITSTSFMLEVR